MHLSRECNRQAILFCSIRSGHPRPRADGRLLLHNLQPHLVSDRSPGKKNLQAMLGATSIHHAALRRIRHCRSIAPDGRCNHDHFGQ